MAHIYSEEAIVRIWRNVKKYGKIPTGHFGHAAVTIRGTAVPNSPVYISFWPGDSAGMDKTALRKQAGHASDSYSGDKESEMDRLTALRLEVGYRQRNNIDIPDHWTETLESMGKTALAAPRAGQKRTGQTYQMEDDDGDVWDFPLWSQSAEAKINLPGLGAGSSLWGLSTRRMALWWNQFQQTKPQYQALSRKGNCAGVALLGLRAGGSEAYAKPPSITIYAEPIQVENYANAILTAIRELNRITQDVDNDVRAAVIEKKLAPTPTSELKDGLYTAAAWKNKSHLGGMTIRSGTVRDIDSAVEKFHAANWANAYSDRLKALANMMTALAKHRREKPDSKRSEALIRLSSQVIAILRNPGPIR